MKTESVRKKFGDGQKPDFSRRSQELEIMDDPSVGFEEYRTALRQIALLNRWTRSYIPILRAIDRLVGGNGVDPSRPIRILDVGCGYGDTLRRICVWAREKGISVLCTGIDVSPWAEISAREATPADYPIAFYRANVFSWTPPDRYDVILNSLFTHHLSDLEIAHLFRWMTEFARFGWFVSDLHRHSVPYYFIRYFVRLVRFNRLLKNDAPLSVARSFSREDLLELVGRAGIPRKKVSIRWHWAFRYGVLYRAG
jgi:SAM-dependent methyltransferase